jgi:hypothetical protein
LVEQGAVSNGRPVHQTAQRKALTAAKEPAGWVGVIENDAQQGRRPRRWEQSGDVDYHLFPLRVKDIGAQQGDKVITALCFEQQAPRCEILLKSAMVKTEYTITALDE